MKILGGKFKGKNFYMPYGIRPTQDVVRKAIFDILGGDLKGLDFLDIFAGSGAVGLEAISRSARSVAFVEQDERCLRVIESNINLLTSNGYENKEVSISVIAGSAFAVIKELYRQDRRFHVVFLDPPYQGQLAKKTLKLLSRYDILHPKSFLIIQHHKNETLPDAQGRFILIRKRKYTGSFLSLYEGG